LTALTLTAKVQLTLPVAKLSTPFEHTVRHSPYRLHHVSWCTN